MNDYGWWAIGFLIVALLGAAYLLYRQKVQGPPAVALSTPSEPLARVVSSAMAPHARALEQSVVKHVADWGAAIRTDIAKINPAAPAASVAAQVPPPPAAAAPGLITPEPSADSGGTAQPAVFVPVPDQVIAAHATLDAAIAAHQAAIVTAQTKKDALTAAQMALQLATSAATH